MRQSILIADDVEFNRDLLTEIFEDEYDVKVAKDGYEALKAIEKEEEGISAILLDIVMPGCSGIDVLKKMGEGNLLTKIPVLMITTDAGAEVEEECLFLGASDFIKKPFSPTLVKTRVKNTVNLYSYKNHLEEKVEAQTKKLVKYNHQFVNMLGNLVESRNLESGEHVQRVAGYTRELAICMMRRYPEYGLTMRDIDVISDSAALHDIGKIAIPDAVLLKPGKLTDEEFETMKAHTTLGAEYLEKIVEDWDPDYIKASIDIAKYHHERYDGRGYPEHLEGDEIPISAQLVSVADVYDALTHERCYKKAFPKEEAYNMILAGECGVFSPKLLECFKECYPFLSIED